MPDTSPLFRLIRRTRLLLRSTWVLTGLGLAVGLGLGALVATTFTDLAVPLWTWLRLVALLLIVVPAGWALLAWVLWPLCRFLSPVNVARRIESRLPGIHNRLVSTIDLAQGNAPPHSPAFHRRLLNETLERTKGFRPSRLVDFRRLRRAGLVTLATAGAFIVSWLLFSDRLPTALARIFMPFADIPPASGVVYSVEPGTAQVLRGEQIAFTANVSRGTPKKLWLEMYSLTGAKPLRHDLVSEGNVWTVKIGSGNIGDGFKDGFEYRVYGGGTWSKLHKIAILDRPEILSQHTVLHFPEYMGEMPPRVGQPGALEVIGPEGSQVEVVVESKGQVSAGDIQFVEYRQPAAGMKNVRERAWFQNELPAGATRDGTWTWDDQRFHRQTHTEPPALGVHGHWFQDAKDGFAVGTNDVLFAWVYLVPDHKPETIMLEWTDGTSWEHRACWGKDSIPWGKANTAARRHLGPLPEAGKWVRLDVPVDQVGLAGKTLRGMAFRLNDGQCYWHTSGALGAVAVPVKTFPVELVAENRWSGRFPLEGGGLYRVELRNEAGHANEHKGDPGKYLALKDQPPQIVLERPGTDLVLSEPAKVPLVASAYDDYGLLDVSVNITRGDGDKTTTTNKTLKSYDKPTKSDNVVSALDLAELQVKPGETLRYRVQARDRKRQAALTQEYTIRLAADKSGLDQQLAALDKNEDAFHKKLADLIASQEKVRDAAEKLAAKYQPLVEKIEAQGAKVEIGPDGSVQVKDPNDKYGPKLDPEAEKQLKELQKELSELAQQEQKNAQAAEQVHNDLGQMAQQAASNPLVPKPLSDQMKAVQDLFSQVGVQPMKNLAGQMTKGADPKNPPPDLKKMQGLTDRLQKELEGIRKRLEALADARKNLMRGNLNDLFAQLQKEMQRQNAGMTARELQELRDFIAQLRKELERFQGAQDNLAQNTDRTDPKDLPNAEKKQDGLDRELQKLLDAVKNLLAGDKDKEKDKIKKMRRRPNFPDEPYAADGPEEKVRPKEEDPDEPDKKNAKDAGKTGESTAKDDKKKDGEDEDPLYTPNLGGPKPKLDPRYDKRRRPVDKKPKDNANDPDARRENLRDRQDQRARDLEAARQSLGSDQQALEQMLRQLAQAMQKGKSGQPMGQEEGDDDLSQMMQSPLMQQALAMAQRMRQGPPGRQQAQQGQPGQPMGPSQSVQGNLQGAPRDGKPLDGELAKLDPATRNVILKMPPRVREELLQGMREEGPEGYRKFIEDYFKRLTEVKSTQKP
jgi:hypothetical protein